MVDTPAGVLLDAQLARLLWQVPVLAEVVSEVAFLIGDGQRYLVPKFSTDIDESRRLVRMMKNLGYQAKVRSQGDGTFCACFVQAGEDAAAFINAPTRPLAVTRAALVALAPELGDTQ